MATYDENAADGVDLGATESANTVFYPVNADSVDLGATESANTVFYPVNADTASITSTPSDSLTITLQVIDVLTQSTVVSAYPYQEEVSDGFSVGSSIDASIAWAVSEGILLEASASAQQVFAEYLSDGTDLRSALIAALTLFASDQVSLAETLDEVVNRMLAAAELVRAAGVASTTRESFVVVSTGVLAQTLASHALLLTANDIVEASDELVALRSMFVDLMEEAAISENATGTISFVMLAESGIAPGSTVAGFIEYFLSAEDIIDFRAAITTPDGADYTAWVTNLKGAVPYEYTNYDFNSFAVVGDKVLGCKSDGIYLLDGDDDQGTPIDARVKWGLMDFGSPQMKRITDAILAYSSDGEMILRVTTTDLGYKQEYYYQITETHGDVKEGRVKLGKGARAKYWQFELENVDGADFDLDSFAIVPITLRRRV